MYKPYRASLKAIWRELSRASRKYPPLFHQRISDALLVGPNVISDEAFLAFQKAYPQRPADEWVSWQRTPDGSYWGRFHGSQNGLDEFERLAESAYLVLQEFDAELPEGHGVHGWLNVIHDMARDFPTPLLRTRSGVWGAEPQPVGDKFDELVTGWAKCEETGVSYRPHPLFNLLAHSVFTSSMSAIEMILDPEKALLVGDEWLDDFPVTLPGPGVFGIAAGESDVINGSAKGVTDVDIRSDASDANESAVLSEPRVEFRFDGATWHLRFALGNISEEGTFTFKKDLIGLKLYRVLLQKDNLRHHFSPADLYKAAGEPYAKELSSSTGDVDADAETRRASLLDDDEGTATRFHSRRIERFGSPEGKSQVAKMLKELEEERATCVNPNRVNEIDTQIQDITFYQRKITNLRSESRLMEPTAEELGRKRVVRALTAARDNIVEKMPRFVQYLMQTVKPTGGWSYDPRRHKFIKA